MVPELVSHVENKERIENKGICQMTQSCPAIGIGTIRPIPAFGAGLIMRICDWPAPNMGHSSFDSYRHGRKAKRSLTN